MNLQITDILARIVDTSVGADTILMQGTPTEFFGADAVLNIPAQVASVVERPIEEPFYKILTIVMLLMYLYVTYVFSDGLRLLLKSLFSVYESNSIFTGEDSVTAYVISMCVTGWLALALFATNYVWFKGLSDLIVPLKWLTPFMVAVFLMWNLYRWVLLKLSGNVMQNVRPSKELFVGQCRLFAVFSTFAVPLILFAVFGRVEEYDITHILFVILLSLYFIFYFFKTLYLFVKEKISILFWILYLCTVDIMPIVTVVVLMLNIR